MFCGKKNLDRCGRTLPIIGTYCITIITILSYTAHTNIADWVCVHCQQQHECIFGVTVSLLAIASGAPW